MAFQDLQQSLTEVRLAAAVETLNDALALIQMALLELDGLYANLSDLPDTSKVIFFKQIRPKFVALWLFNLERHHLILSKPVGAKQVLRSFYESELQHLFCTNLLTDIRNNCYWAQMLSLKFTK